MDANVDGTNNDARDDGIDPPGCSEVGLLNSPAIKDKNKTNAYKQTCFHLLKNLSSSISITLYTYFSS